MFKSNQIKFYSLYGFSPTGNRGIVAETWNITYGQTAEQILALTDPDMVDWVDHLHMSAQRQDFYTTRMKGYFIPPSDNDYRFYVRADHDVFLWFSPTQDPADMVSFKLVFCMT